MQTQASPTLCASAPSAHPSFAGFICRPDMTERELAGFLQRNEADSWQTQANANIFRAPNGEAIAVVFYDSAKRDFVAWTRQGLA